MPTLKLYLSIRSSISALSHGSKIEMLRTSKSCAIVSQIVYVLIFTAIDIEPWNEPGITPGTYYRAIIRCC